MASLSPPSPNDSNLSVKYGKLAAEYAKLRSQFGVVKKAVLEEKEKNAEMTEDLRKKELAARKTEAEMEAINFRNQQLTRRIQVLQVKKGRGQRPLLSNLENIIKKSKLFFNN